MNPARSRTHASGWRPGQAFLATRRVVAVLAGADLLAVAVVRVAGAAFFAAAVVRAGALFAAVRVAVAVRAGAAVLVVAVVVVAVFAAGAVLVGVPAAFAFSSAW